MEQEAEPYKCYCQGICLSRQSTKGSRSNHAGDGDNEEKEH